MHNVVLPNELFRNGIQHVEDIEIHILGKPFFGWVLRW